MRRPRRGSRWGIQRGQAWLPLRWRCSNRGQWPSGRNTLLASTKRWWRTDKVLQHPNLPRNLYSLVYQEPSTQKSKWTSIRRRRQQHSALSLVRRVHLLRSLMLIGSMYGKHVCVVFVLFCENGIKQKQNYISRLRTVCLSLAVIHRRSRVLLNAGATM